MAKMPVRGCAGMCLAGMMLAGCQTSRPAWGRNTSSPPRAATASATSAPTPVTAANAQSKPTIDASATNTADAAGRPGSNATGSLLPANGGNYPSSSTTGAGSFGTQPAGPSSPVFTNPSPASSSFGNGPGLNNIQPIGGSSSRSDFGGGLGQSSLPTPPPTSGVPTMPAPSLRTPEE
jgi:hypothetical protein